MKIYYAEYKNTSPNMKGVNDRSFYDRGEALRWLSSHGLGKFSHLFIDGADVKDEIKMMRMRTKKRLSR